MVHKARANLPTGAKQYYPSRITANICNAFLKDIAKMKL